MNTEEIKKIIEENIPDAEAFVEGGGAKFLVTVISDEFDGLSPVNRQRKVYAALNAYIASGEIHAVTIKALSVAEGKSYKMNIDE